jgi:hypothetical protein
MSLTLRYRSRVQHNFWGEPRQFSVVIRESFPVTVKMCDFSRQVGGGLTSVKGKNFVAAAYQTTDDVGADESHPAHDQNSHEQSPRHRRARGRDL